MSLPQRRTPSAACPPLAGLLALLAAACGPAPGDDTHPPSCGQPPLVFDPSGTVLQGDDDDGACVRLERRPIGEPGMMYQEYPYQPLRLTAAAGGAFLDVTEGDSLSYTASHHNWLDEMSGVADDGTSATVVIRYRVPDDAWVLELTVSDAAGAILAGPVALTPSGS